MNTVSIIGTGYVGLVTGACLADFGIHVICIDNNPEKVALLQKGIMPIYEEGLETLVERNAYYKRLEFTSDIQYGVEKSDVIFISVGTPPHEDGAADMTHVIEVAKQIGKYMNGYKVVVNKSTVPVGAGQMVKGIIGNILREEKKDFDFDVVSNPEFLREGSAIHDFTHPDRVVMGLESDQARAIMENVYRVLYLNETPFVITNIETAEMIKYASNAFLATKVTFINEIANLCEKVGADVHHVAKAMGKDGRISPKFLHPGPGFGGSCFPKDTRALAKIGRDHGVPMTLVEQTIEANESQKLRMADKIKHEMKDLNGKIISVLGITFKPNTDDLRDAPSLTILDQLAKSGAHLRVYDPQGEKEGKIRFEHIKKQMDFCCNEYDAMLGADALVILTEWNQFRSLDLEQAQSLMKDNYFFDLRNIYERAYVEGKGFKYYCVGR